jgi:hypothetical protein
VADNLASQENKTISGVSAILKDKFERLNKSGVVKTNEETMLVGYKRSIRLLSASKEEMMRETNMTKGKERQVSKDRVTIAERKDTKRQIVIN